MIFRSLAIASALISSASVFAADIPSFTDAQHAPPPVRSVSELAWKTVPFGDSAHLVTLFCHACSASGQDVPLVAVLHDSLGSGDADRLSYLWLLAYAPSNWPHRILGAIPFFCWRVGDAEVNAAHLPRPVMDLAAPRPVVAERVGTDLLQWTFLNGTPARASSHAYQSNALDHERSHIEQAVEYLRAAPAGVLSREQIDTLTSRLELRERLLGELATDPAAEKAGEEAGFNLTRIRMRNAEILRECAEKTGLRFEPLTIGGTSGEFAMLSLPVGSAPEPGLDVSLVWKLLGIRDPFHDGRIKSGAEQNLAVYSLDYPRMPLLLVDFRDTFKIRRRELTQRYINELTNGVIGVSHFANWYYFVASDVYDFIASRHGAALDASARLDSYARFRIALAIDHDLDRDLRQEMRRRADAAALNPLDCSPERELQSAALRYQALLNNSGKIVARLDKDRRAELATYESTRKADVWAEFAHFASFGAYTRRSPERDWVRLAAARELNADLAFLRRAAQSPNPEVEYDRAILVSKVSEAGALSKQFGFDTQQTNILLAQFSRFNRDTQLAQSATAAASGE